MPEPASEVLISRERAIDFGVIEKKYPKKKYCRFQAKSIGSDDATVSIVFNLDGEEIKKEYKKDDLSKEKNVFIAWVYLMLDNWENKNKEEASKYLYKAIEEELDFFNDKPRDWIFPYYLISKHDLKVKGVPDPHKKLYYFLDTNGPFFEDFFIEIIRKEKNPIRKVYVAKIAEKRYPENGWFIGAIADDLFAQCKYADCVAYLLRVKKRFKNKSHWKRIDGRTTLIRCYIFLKKYDAALGELKVIKSSKGVDDQDSFELLRGLVLCEKGDYKSATKQLENVIVKDYVDTSTTTLASYFLLFCYAKLGNKAMVRQIADTLVLQQDDLFEFGVSIDYAPYVSKALREFISSGVVDDMSLAKVKGMLAYILQKTLVISGSETSRKLTTKESEEVAEIASLIDAALEYFPNERFFNILYSNLLNVRKDFNKAMDYKLKSLTQDSGADSLYADVNLSSCTADYLLLYLEKVKGLLDDDYSNYVKNYEFDSAVQAFWDKKMYRQIADLYKEVESSISDFSRIGDTGDGGLFEIAYSLNENGDIEKAKWVYEKHIEINKGNSSVLNNLALIYEKQKDLAKAKKMIKKAKALGGVDEIVTRNYERLFAKKNADSSIFSKPRSEAPIKKRKELVFDKGNGEVVYGDKKAQIPLSSNQYQLCSAVFDAPHGEWIKEADVIDSFYKGKDSERSFYDAVRLSNVKIKDGIGIQRLFEYKAARVRIRKEVLG